MARTDHGAVHGAPTVPYLSRARKDTQPLGDPMDGMWDHLRVLYGSSTGSSTGFQLIFGVFGVFS